MDDEELMRAVAAGDDVALRELFDRHSPWVAARLRRRMPASAVEDVLQETFVAIWRGSGGYGGKGAAAAWIWGVARRQSALWARKNSHREARHEESGIELGPARADDFSESAAWGADLRRAFAEIGAEGSDQRELARLVFVEERPLAEVAETFGVPQGTVKSRVYRLRRALRAKLERGA